MTITKLAITQIGPHTTATISLGATTTITGPSGAGKSTLIDIIGAGLGLGDRDAGWLSGQSTSESSAIVTLDTGHRIQWTQGSSYIVPAGVTKRPAGHKSTKSFLQALCDIGVIPGGITPSLMRLAIMPGDWLRAAEADPKTARAFRDTLAPIMGDRAETVRAALTDAGYPTWIGPTTEADLSTALTDARAAVQRAQGALDAYTATLAAEPVADPGPAPAMPAHAAAPLWRTYDTAVDAVSRWEAATVPPEPETSPEAAAETRATLLTARTAWSTYRANRAAIEAADKRAAEIAAWDAAIADLGPEPTPLPAVAAPRSVEQIDADIEAAQSPTTTCQECGQTLPEDALQLVNKLAADRVAKLNTERLYAIDVYPAKAKAAEEATRAIRDWNAARYAIGTRPAALARPAAIEEPTDAEPTQAQIDAANSAVSAATTARAARQAAIRARGQRPADPVEPATPRPTADDLATETAAQRKHSEAATLYRADQVARATAERHRATAERSVADAERKVADLSAVRDAIRTVPSRLAAAAEWLTAIESTVTLTDAGVTIRGRSSRRASTGERAHADAVFRAALLTRLGGTLPLIIDGAQDWSGDWPTYAGQTLILRTAAGSGLTIT